jgi:capsular exopolysaccharide synthesis family protein
VIRKLHLDENPDLVSKSAKLPAVPAALDSHKSVPNLTPAENVALRVFRRRLGISRDATSRIVSVSFESHNPVLAADVANTMLNTFIELTYERRRAGIAKLSTWLESQLKDVRAKLDDSTRTLAAFQAQTGIADIDTSKNTVSERMAELGKQETQAEAERIQLQTLLQSVTRPDALADVHSNPVVQDLSKKLADAQVDLKRKQVIYGENHPEVKKLQIEVSELQGQLNAQTDSIVRQLQTSRAAAESRQGALSRDMKATATQLNQVARYNELKKEVETNTTLYNNLYQKIKEAGIAAGARSTDMQIVDAARVLDRPTRPNWLLNLAGGAFAGLLGGILIACVRVRLDNRIHGPDDFAGLMLASGVSYIPALGTDLNYRERNRLRKTSETGPIEKYLQTRPSSPEAEAVRGLKTSVLLGNGAARQRVLLVTSSLPREGKSTLAINLAVALSKQGKTCLVDADLRAARIASTFNIPRGSGLSDVLAGRSSLTLHPVPDVPNLTILSAGNEIADANPGELMSTGTMVALLEQLRSDFDSVVIDSPPLMPFMDGRLLATLVDGIVFVCRHGVTTKEAFAQSKQILSNVNAAPIIQVVMNGAQMGSHRYPYYPYSSRPYGHSTGERIA